MKPPTHPTPSERPSSALLNLTALFTWLAVGALGLHTLSPQAPWPWPLAAWLAFGLLLVWNFLSNYPHPHGYLALQTLLTAFLMAYGPAWNAFPLLFFLLSAQGVLLLPGRQVALWIALFVAVTFGFAATQDSLTAALLGTPAFAAGYLFFAAFGYALRRAQQSQAETQRLLRELQAAHERLRAQAAQAAALAVAEERNRMAQEMHDTLGHHLTVAAVQLEAAQALVKQDPDRAAALITTVRAQIRQSLGELRRTVAALRQPVDDLPAALQTLAARFTAATGLPVAVDCQKAPTELPAAHRLLLYRAAQEGLTNVQRHAHARQAWLRLTRQHDGVLLALEDDGVGPPPNPSTQGGIGLRGMAEQAQRLGGYARLLPRPQGGARLEVYLPLPAENAS